MRHFHISHHAPYLLSKILHNLCFSFLLGITAVPREIENNTYAKFGGQMSRYCLWDRYWKHEGQLLVSFRPWL